MKDKLLVKHLISSDRNSINKDNSSNKIAEEIKESSESTDFDLKLDPLGLGLSSQNRKELSQEQLEKLKYLQNPQFFYDEFGNVIFDDK